MNVNYVCTMSKACADLLVRLAPKDQLESKALLESLEEPETRALQVHPDNKGPPDLRACKYDSKIPFTHTFQSLLLLT